MNYIERNQTPEKRQAAVEAWARFCVRMRVPPTTYVGTCLPQHEWFKMDAAMADAVMAHIALRGTTWMVTKR